jgi:peptidoglycan/LPS O-acetylase OafA/YrhL
MSVLYIIWGHRVGMIIGMGLINMDAFFEWYDTLNSAVFNTHQVAVDTFLFMAGLLFVWSMLPSLDRGTVNIWRMYLKRYLRYTPPLIACLLFTISIQKFFRFGPLTDQTNYQSQENCQKWWWGILLHTQIYVNPSELCLDQSWYLAVDFHLFLISPLLLYPVWKYGKKCLWILPTLTLLSSIYIFIISYQKEISPMVTRLGGLQDLFRFIYYPTHTRVGPWFIGMTLGYILHKSKGKKIHLNPIVDALMWILSLSILIAITVSCVHIFKQPANRNTVTQLEGSFYIALYRNGWSLALFWVVYACQNGSGGIVRW